MRCNKGFRLIGTNIISCGEDQEFVDLPECVDIDECANANPCDFSSTECVNTKVKFIILIVPVGIIINFHLDSLIKIKTFNRLYCYYYYFPGKSLLQVQGRHGACAGL